MIGEMCVRMEISLGSGYAAPNTPGKNWTIEQTMEKWQNILNFVCPGQSIRIAP